MLLLWCFYLSLNGPISFYTNLTIVIVHELFLRRRFALYTWLPKIVSSYILPNPTKAFHLQHIHNFYTHIMIIWKSSYLITRKCLKYSFFCHGTHMEIDQVEFESSINRMSNVLCMCMCTCLYYSVKTIRGGFWYI